MHHHTATADCTAQKRLAIRSLVENNEGQSAWFKPRSREMNVEYIVFVTYHSTSKYCGITPDKISHLHCPCVTQLQMDYSLGGPSCHSENGLDTAGVAVGCSWPGETCLRLLEENRDLNKKETDNDNDNVNLNVNKFKSLRIVPVHEVSEKVNQSSHFLLKELNIHDTVVHSSCCIAVWNRCRRDSHGRI